MRAIRSGHPSSQPVRHRRLGRKARTPAPQECKAPFLRSGRLENRDPAGMVFQAARQFLRMHGSIEQMQRYAEQEENEACREMIEDNIREIGHGIAGGAMRHRFFLVFQYEPSMRAKRNTVQAIIQRLNEEADTARRYLDLCELEVLEPQYSDNFVLKLLYEILNKKTSQRVRLPEGVFDMTTAVHGIYEE